MELAKPPVNPAKKANRNDGQSASRSTRAKTLKAPSGSPSENAHLELLALLYEHSITKGAAMEAGKGGVADIELPRFGDDWTARLKAANAHALW
jgi:hypothetical protein